MLIIGKNGQVATHLTKQAAGRNFVQMGSDQINLEDNSSIISGLENFEKHSSQDTPKIIINAGAYTNVELAESEFKKAYQINGEALETISGFAKKYGYLLVHYSTDYVFDGKKTGEYSEEDIPCPINKYGLSKLVGENNIKESGCDYLILRTSWVFSSIGVNFVKKMSELLQSRDELKVIDDQIGRPTYAGFIADVTYRLIDHYNGKNPKEIINICQPETTSWYGLAREVRNILLEKNLKAANLLPIKSSEYPQKAARPNNSTLSIKKLEQILSGYKVPSWKLGVLESLNKLYGN